MKSVLLLLSSPSSSERVQIALRLASSLLRQGIRPILFLIEDAVALAMKSAKCDACSMIKALREQGSFVFALDEHLAKRGIPSRELLAEVAGYDRLIELVTSEQIEAMGTF